MVPRPGARLKTIVVDRPERTLRLYRRKPFTSKDILEMEFPVAVGAVGHRTPWGVYRVRSKAKDPEWQMPKSDWVPPADWGRVIEGGTVENPLKSRWIGVWDEQGIGIHGTSEDASIGTAASHGCLRMHVPDIVLLYPHVPKGTTVVIV